jgi:hypothetical protein
VYKCVIQKVMSSVPTVATNLKESNEIAHCNDEQSLENMSRTSSQNILYVRYTGFSLCDSHAARSFPDKSSPVNEELKHSQHYKCSAQFNVILINYVTCNLQV